MLEKAWMIWKVLEYSGLIGMHQVGSIFMVAIVSRAFWGILGSDWLKMMSESCTLIGHHIFCSLIGGDVN